MNTYRPVWFWLAFLLTLISNTLAAASLEPREWKIDGVAREALVYVPESAKTNPAPVIFAFHGHGGSMRNASRMFSYHTRWPEAIVVYPQGLNTPGRLTDPDGRLPGWQKDIGDQKDRDLTFFDQMLKSLRQDYKMDGKRVYATGHSNGGAFSYLLWAARGDDLAAVAPSAAPAPPAMFKHFKPKPVFHSAGENDPLVKFEWQKATMEAVRRLNQCGEGKPWGKEYCTVYESRIGAPVVTLIHPGKHNFPEGAADAVVQFFKENPGR